MRMDDWQDAESQEEIGQPDDEPRIESLNVPEDVEAAEAEASEETEAEAETGD